MPGDKSIDAVITWVDGSDPVHYDSLLSTLDRLGIQRPTTVSTGRLADAGELNYCVTALLRFAPWLNRIYIVTDSQTPEIMARLRGTPGAAKVSVVDHREIFAGYEQFLPTFNTRSISTMLWRIPGIADRFLYLNDDFFVIKPVSPDHFFSSDGVFLRGRYSLFKKTGWLERTYGASRWMRGKSSREMRPGYVRSQEVASRLAGANFQYLNLHHNPHPIRRDWLEAYFSRHPAIMEANIRHPFRHPDQFVIESFFASLALKMGRGKIDTRVQGQMIKPRASTKGQLERELKATQQNRFRFVCIQDLSDAAEDARACLLAWLQQTIGEPEDL